jgi:hypothetical protein
MSNFRGATVSDRRSIGNLLDRFEISPVDPAESRRLAVSPYPGADHSRYAPSRFHAANTNTPRCGRFRLGAANEWSVAAGPQSSRALDSFMTIERGQNASFEVVSCSDGGSWRTSRSSDGHARGDAQELPDLARSGAVARRLPMAATLPGESSGSLT